MKSRYDIIVVGAGPGGCTAAGYAARAGLDVLLIERNREIGVPVRCAEAVIMEESVEFVASSPKLIAATINKVLVSAPNGRTLDVDVDIYVLERDLFEKELACQAGAAGTDILLRTRATGLILREQIVSGVVMERMGETVEVESKIVIAADGIESQVGRWAGLGTSISFRHTNTCAQYLMGNVATESSVCKAFFGKQVAPGGYAWIFPKGHGKANVGLGISGKYSQKKTAMEHLDEFVRTQCPEAVPLAVTVGGFPATGTSKHIVGNGIMLVGDAARQTNPLSGAGIVEAMQAGREAAKVSIEAFERNDFSESFLQTYSNSWDVLLGKAHKKDYYLKELVFKLPDIGLNSLSSFIGKVAPQNLTLNQLLDIGRSFFH